MMALWDYVRQSFGNGSGFPYLSGPMVTMWAICGILFYLAVRKGHQPQLLLPIAFGVLLANLPTRALYDGGWATDGIFHPTAGLLYHLSQGLPLELLAPLVFLGVGARTDFGPLIASPRLLLLGGAAQLGVFAAMFCALASGAFTTGEAASVGMIGAASGPAAIFAANKLALQLIGPVATATYCYLSLAPLIQSPIMKALTSAKERSIQMESPRQVSRGERIVFPLVVMVLGTLVAPDASPLLAMLMLGNVLRESGVADQLAKSCRDEIANVTTIFLGTAVGLTMQAESFLRPTTLAIVALGMVGFALSTASGVVMAKIMNALSPLSPVNPSIGTAAVSAWPFGDRVSQQIGVPCEPQNSLELHAMGTSVAGVIATAVTAGYLMSRLL